MSWGGFCGFKLCEKNCVIKVLSFKVLWLSWFYLVLSRILDNGHHDNVTSIANYAIDWHQPSSNFKVEIASLVVPSLGVSISLASIEEYAMGFSM